MIPDIDNAPFAPYRFNRNPLVKLERPVWGQDNSERQILSASVKSTLGLYCASLDDAMKYGGDLTRYVMSYCPLKNDRKYITVDTKIHMLMHGMSPAIPGWHTDGVPRDRDFSPVGSGLPDIWAQDGAHVNPPRFHLLLISDSTLAVCPTLFLVDEIDITIPKQPDKGLYAAVSADVQRRYRSKELDDKRFVPTLDGHWYSWDWWNIHTGQVAKHAGWRYLIRVTESDYLPPKTNLRDVIRTHQQAYAKPEFGW